MKRGLWLRIAAVVIVVLVYPLTLHWALTHWTGSQRVLSWLALLQTVTTQWLLALFFGLTLRPGHEPLIARFARRVHGAEYSPEIARYARGATWAWTLFFVAMAVTPIALFTLGDVAIFSLFVNVWSLPLLGAMFVAEYLARRWILRGVRHASPWRSFAIYRETRRQQADSGAPGA